MTLTAFLLIFVSVFLHAGWNFISKKSTPSAAFYMLSSATAALIWFGFFLHSGIPCSALPGRFWWILAFSWFGEMLYCIGLAYGYRRGDISLVYPLGRSLPVLLTAAVTISFGLGKTPDAFALGGMALISIGCLFLPLKSFREFHWKTYCTPLLFFVLLIAAGVTVYTIFDSEAAKILKELPDNHDSRLVTSLFYLFLVESGLAAVLGLFVLTQKQERAEFKRLFLKTPWPHITGVFSSSAYALILLAMPLVTNVSYIQAFRQMRLPLGVLAGVFILKEACGQVKLFGIILIVIGLIASSF